MSQRVWLVLLLVLAGAASASGCGDGGGADGDGDHEHPDGAHPADGGTDGTGRDGAAPTNRDPNTIAGGAAVTVATVYEAVEEVGRGFRRPWHPVDLAVHPQGELWVIQRMDRDPVLTDRNECSTPAIMSGAESCIALQGSTVAIREPGAAEPASSTNGRATLVVDANSWHFMRRPSAIAFGSASLEFTPRDPGAAEGNVTTPRTFANTFATCAEHWTGNPTDSAPFIGPALWTADSAYYNGGSPNYEGSNGAHLDMVHGTQYCMGIAYESGNSYWLFNGHLGTLDRYDFGAPHYPGHHDHGDATITRFLMPEGNELTRVQDVPSNLIFDNGDLFVADTGRGRILRFDTTSPTTRFGTAQTPDPVTITSFEGLAYSVVADQAVLGAAWGGQVQPSGLALLDANTLVAANHGTGHITLIDRNSGELIRTIDTGTGPGLGGLTVLDGVVYVAQITQRKVLRLDVSPR